MKKKMLILDLDRSLLKNDKTISEYTVNILNKCHNSDVIIIIATARPIRTAHEFIDIIKPDGAIFHNGAIVMVNNKTLIRHGIESIKVKQIIKKIEKEYSEATISVEMNDIMYTNFDLPVNLPYEKIKFNQLPNYDADKIIIGSIALKQIKEIEQYITPDLYLEINDGRYGFIMNKNASKWLGVKELAKYFKINKRNTIAFGDDINDLTMLKNCGKGICMKNGLEEVKAIANDICEDNENDGIAKWIEKNIL
jgi:Cof subfamily protein (haloacid dehalogenase superfamily)